VTSATSTLAQIDLEIYGSNGARAYQALYDNQAFTAGQQRTFATTWQVPSSGAATGSYVVDVGVVVPGWAST
jgi:hypothetical protein